MNKEQITAIKEATKHVWGTNPAGWTHAQNAEKGSREFFEQVFAKRSTQELPFLPEVAHFSDYAGKKVLEIGCGAGYDAYQFCKAGADYVGIDLVPANIVLTKKHLSYYGYNPIIEELDAEEMNFVNQFDLIYSFGVLHHIPRMEQVIEKSFTALKSGGTVCFIVYYKYSIAYFRVVLNWLLRGKFLKESLADALSRVEDVGSNERPLVRVYSAKQFTKIVKNAGFKITEVKVRKLTQEDLPTIKPLGWFYSSISQSFLDKVARWFGWYLCVTATKE